MKKLIICLSMLAMFVAGQAFADTIIVDDFSGDLSAYTKSLVLVRSAYTGGESGALAKTNFSVADGVLSYGASVTGVSPNDVFQTTLLRDDYSLGIGDRLQVDLTSINQTTATGTESRFALCIAAQEAYTYSTIDTRQNYLTLQIVDYAGTASDRLEYQYFNGTANSNTSSKLSLSSIAGLYIERTDSGLYNLGYIAKSTGDDVELWTDLAYTGGANAIGFYSDSRDAKDPFVTADNLTLITAATVPEPSTALMIFVGLAMLAVRKRVRS